MGSHIKKIIVLLMAILMLSACSGNKTEVIVEQEVPFETRLDTEKEMSLEVAIFFNNFEAFDQVINHFNDYYPNVAITYEQISSSKMAEFLNDNSSTDIFMTSVDNGYPKDYCYNLSSADIDLSAIDEKLLASNTKDGKLYAIPMGEILRGMVVNKTLLEKEGLEVPQTWPEFIEVLDSLKQKGYTPIQGTNQSVGNIAYNMVLSMLNTDSKLVDAINSFDTENAQAIKQAYGKIEYLLENGYTTSEVNNTYPMDNYNDAIMTFLNGNVPFWACNTEKYSGMKKREQKSEAFQANPFEYEFIYAPLGENGVYEYIEPWYGFSVNKNCDNLDYALEFMRFMARKDELNTLSSIKGVPSITKYPNDERYSNLNDIEKIEMKTVDEGKLYRYFGQNFETTCAKLIDGTFASVDEAYNDFLSRCNTTYNKIIDQGK